MNKKIVSMIAILSGLLILLTACGSSNTAAYDNGYVEAAPEEDVYYAEAEAADYDGYEYYDDEADYAYYDEYDTDTAYSASTAAAGSSAAESAYSSNAKLIRRASLSLESRSFDETCTAIEQLTASLGGYMESSEIYGEEYSYSAGRTAYYTARVPSESYDSFLSAMGDISECQMVSRSESTEDVGQTYADIETHIEMLNTKLERLNNLMSEATKMEDIITIEDAITDTEYELASYSAEKNSYDDLIGFSTFSIDISEVLEYTPIEEPTFGERLGSAFVSGLENFVDGLQSFIVWFLGNLIGIIIFVIIVIVIVLLIKKLRKKSAAKKAARAAAMPYAAAYPGAEPFRNPQYQAHADEKKPEPSSSEAPET